MLQLGFGHDAFRSGPVTFVGAVGALSSNFVAQWVFRRFGVRSVLTDGALAAAGFIAANCLFTPTPPHLVIMACLLAGGVLDLAGRMHGGGILLGDFQVAFLMVALVSGHRRPALARS